MEHNTPTHERIPRSKKSMIGNYKIKRKLGEGSFGCVYQAKHVITKQKVAIKLVAIRSSHHKQSALREASILRHLQCEQQEFHIVQLIEVFELEPEECTIPLSEFPGIDESLIRSILCMVTEYIKGGDLIDHVQARNRLKEEEAAKLFRQLLVAVQWCHMNQVIHRDIKLENIMMASKTCLKLIDFGLSQFVDAKTAVRNFVGSIAYTAPEVFSREDYDGEIADVWSCGVVLYAMLTGEFPWEGLDAKEQATNILKARWIFPKDVSADCYDLLKSILTADPIARLTISEIMSHPWMQKYTAAQPKRLSAERGAGKQELTPTSSLDSPKLQRLNIGSLFKKKPASHPPILQRSQNSNT